MIVWIYDGGEGSTRAAPVAHDILDFYFRRSLGLLDQPEGEAPSLLEATP